MLVHPEIPGNTGSIIRLCANTGAALHLVEPLGFLMEDRLLRRAGLDYHDLANVTRHPSVDACVAALGARRRFAFTTQATTRYDQVRFEHDDVLVFGPEAAGLTADDLAALQPIETLKIPMRPDNRSINLSNSVAIVLYEAWRQQGFAGAAADGG